MFRNKQLMLLASPVGALIPDALYLRWKYRLLTGKRLNLKHPVTYNEKLQWIKLHDRQSLYCTLVDKAAVKDKVSALIGKEHVIPTLGVWESPEDISWDILPDSFVLKCTHDSGSALLCRDKSGFDRQEACRKLGKSLAKDYYAIDKEWPYRDVPRRIIAEPLLEGGLRDYKFFCFGGKPELMFIASDRHTAGEETKFDFYDMDFRHLDIRNGHPNASAPPEKPACWEEMKALAATLSEGLRHVRVDFYECQGKVLFGEYTFFHWSGMKAWEPEQWDTELGNMIRL